MTQILNRKLNGTKAIILIILAFIIQSCGILRTLSILKDGEVSRKDFKETVYFTTKAGLIFLNVKINNKNYHFIFDSGATNVVSKKVASELNLKPVSDANSNDSEGNSQKIDFTVIDEIKIGELSFFNTAAAILDFESVPELACLEIDGLIGANLMRKALWQIDYKTQSIIITSTRDSLYLPSSNHVIKFKPQASGTPLVDLELYGIKSGKNIFDYGSTGGIMLPMATLDKLKESGKDKKIKMIEGIGSNSAGAYGRAPDSTRVYLASIDTLNIGTLQLTDYIVDFKKVDKFGNLGSRLFVDYIITMDWKKKEIIFQPHANNVQKEFSDFGFAIGKKEDKLIVNFIYEGSPAKAAGIKLGDQLLSLNEADYSIISNEQYCKLIAEELPWKKENQVTMILKSGREERKVKLIKTNYLKK